MGRNTSRGLDFKLGVVQKIKSRADIARVAKAEGVHYATLETWYVRFLAYGVDAFSPPPPKPKKLVGKALIENMRERLDALESWRASLEGPPASGLSVAK